MTGFRAFFTAYSPGHDARALLWEHTIYQVIRLLQEAERRIRTPERQSHYSSLQGWWRSSKARFSGGRSCRIPSEPALSEALVDEIETLREEIILKIVSWDGEFANLDGLQFSLEAPRKQKRGIGTFAKPTDIRVYRLGSEMIDLRIEAKVLIKDAEIAKSYLSTQGMKRFSDPIEPYTDHDIGGMVAYTVSDDRIVWLDKIDSALKTSRPPIPSFRHRVHTLAHDTLFCRVPYNSKNKGSRNEVMIFHVVLEFDSDPLLRRS